MVYQFTHVNQWIALADKKILLGNAKCIETHFLDYSLWAFT